MSISPVSPLPVAPAFAGKKPAPRFEGLFDPPPEPLVWVNTSRGRVQMPASEALRRRGGGGGGGGNDNDPWETLKALFRKYVLGKDD